MIRNAASKALMLAAVTLVSGATAINCSKKSDSDDVGSVGLALTLPGGAIVNTVSYSITGGSLTMPITGSIDVSAPGITQATALVSNLLPGTYTVTMTAMASDGQNCSGMTTFMVVAGQTAMANVILQCTTTAATGTVVINGRLNQCPFITGLTATSLQGVVGGPAITVGVAATERDPGDIIAYSWTNSAPLVGSLSPTNAATGSFSCLSVGSAILSISVSDGICGDSRMNAIPITCVMGAGPGVGGSGGSPAGAGGSGGSAGSGGSPAGVGGSGGSAGSGGSPAGVGGSGGATGGTGGSGPVACIETGLSAGAQATACMACITQFAAPTEGCCNLATSDPAGFTLCQAVSACQRAGGPPVGICNVGGDTTTCHCGTNVGTCDATGATGANGPCVTQTIAAAGRNVVAHTTDAPTPAQVLARLGDTDYAIGRASAIQSFAGGICAGDCGF